MTRIALVTGAAGDIGRAICRGFLAGGAAVAALDYDPERLRSLAGELTEFAGQDRFVPVEADVTRMDSIVSAVETVGARLGDVDVLVNNAGGITQSSLRTTREIDWVHDIDLNLNGPWRCIHALQETMIRRRSGVIVNVASVNGLGIFGHPGYSAAKAGLIHLTRFCAVELGRWGIRSVAVCPGSVKTQIWQERQKARPDIFAEVASWYPTREICTPQDVAALVIDAARQDMPLLNGAVITLDGGLTCGSDRFVSLFTGQPI